MGGLSSHMVDLTRVGVPMQQRHPIFALTALGGARWPFGDPDSRQLWTLCMAERQVSQDDRVS